MHRHNEEIGYHHTYPPQNPHRGTKGHPGLQGGSQTSQPAKELQANQGEAEDAQKVPNREAESQAAKELQGREQTSHEGHEELRRRHSLKGTEERAKQIEAQLAQVDLQENLIGKGTGQARQRNQPRQAPISNRERDEPGAEEGVR
jgi:hypothetical protein